MRRLTSVAVLSLAACANETPVTELKGSCADANGASVCSYATMVGANTTEAGAVVPMSAIENAKDGVMSMDWPPVATAITNLPDASVDKTGLTHMTMYWEGMGHDPAPFKVPHFDFHFYLVPPSDVDAIDCKDESKPAALPVGYALPDQDLTPEEQKMLGVAKLVGICVPKMGMHSLTQNDLLETKPFSATMVIGYYHAKPIFIEPMIAKSFLMTKQSFTLQIPEIPGAGLHPTSFKADYDSTANAYRFRFTNFRTQAKGT